MTDQVEMVIVIPDTIWLTSNGRYHWAVKARATKALRQVGKSAWIAANCPRFNQAAADAFIQVRGGRFDPNNAWPTVKALIDGMVEAGMMPDDDSKHLLGPDMRKDPGKAPPGVRRIRLVITNQKVTW